MNKVLVKRVKRIIIAAGLLAAFAVAALLWGYLIEPSLLTVTNLEIVDNRLPKDMDGTRAVFFSDLHVGSCYSEEDAKRVAAKIQELNPDILLFGGDLTQWENPSNKPDGKIVSAAFAAIKPRYGKYAVYGNHDIWPDEMKGVARKMLADSGFVILENQAVKVTEGFYVAGTKPWPQHLEGEQGGTGQNSMLLAVKRGFFTLLLAHEPAQINDWANYPFALQLSGHTHGGQVALPIIGPLAKTYATDEYYAGQYRVNGIPLFVSRGVGMIDRHVRLFAPPEIVVITFLCKTRDEYR